MIKSRHRWAFPGFRSALKGEQGLNLVEVLIALAILAAVAGVFLVAVSTSSKAVMVGQQQVSAEGLAKSQMESIQQQTYSVDGVSYTKLSSIPTGYDIQFTVVRLDPGQLHTGSEQGLQKITVTVTHGGQTVFTLQGYKCQVGQ
jgi:prepilin-type N-terminal cleavage/methylation domain-containing protein